MARILIIDDDAALRDAIAEAITDLGHIPVQAATGQAGLTALETGIDAVLLDLRMPGLDGMEVLRRIRAAKNPPQVAILTAVPTAANTIEAMRLGALDHLAKPIGRDALAALLARLLPRAASPAPTATASEPEDLVGSSPAMREVQKAIGMLADSTATVLITGETGTGKEIVARAIHRHGARARAPFIAVNCAAIPTELLESQLFGHARGAFTGAVADRRGAFQDADHGTLFLDEIGDMDLAMQAKLLRVLQDRLVHPVGGKPVAVDVRIVAATHRDLPRAVAEGKFREDLYYRLGVVPIALPALRDRPADIVPLAEHFLALAGGAKRLSPDAAAALLAHPWPGNVRELRNAMERAAALVRQDLVTSADLAFLRPAATPAGQQEGTLPAAIAQLEAEMIRRALDAAAGNRAEAARKLGITRQLLYDKMKRLGLE